MKKIIVLLICACCLFLGSCSASFMSGEPTPREKAKLVLECFDNDDAETLKSLFCKETLSSVDNLDEQIEEAFEFYKGKSVDVGPITVAGQESVRYGIVVKESASPRVVINKTSEGKEYAIVLTMFITNVDNPNAVGVSQIDIYEHDEWGVGIDERTIGRAIFQRLESLKISAENLVSWEPTEDQWWITGFNPYTVGEADAKKQVMIASVDFTKFTDVKGDNVVFEAFVDALDPDSDDFEYILLDKDRKTFWIMWYYSEDKND